MSKKTVFITGANAGMGAIAANKLADKGWEVIAGVYPGGDTSQLNTDNPNIHTVDQDVTNDEMVIASAKTVEGILNGRGLNLLINNAGYAHAGQGVVEGMRIEEAKHVFDINLWGMVRVFQSFLPFVRKAAPDARIINYSSGAIIVNPPANSSYNMSKHAVLGLTKTLRHELKPFGVQVTAVKPDAVNTGMTADVFESVKSIWKKVPDNIEAIYKPKLGPTTLEILPQSLVDDGCDPNDVVDQVIGLLDKKKWKPSYIVGNKAKALGPLERLTTELTFEGILSKQFGIPDYKG